MSGETVRLDSAASRASNRTIPTRKTKEARPMTDELELGGRRLSRDELLKLAAATGGAGLLAGISATRAGAALERLGAESGRLKVLDWAGYENDGGQPMFAAYVKKYPNN